MIDVCFTYSELQDTCGKLSIIIDTLRATTTIITALNNGARYIIPVETVNEASKQKNVYKDALLGGERKGLKIDGFDLGNSPLEYSKDIVSGSGIIFTTTNGTRAIKSALGSKIILAALINSKAVSDYIKSAGNEITIVCSGTKGRFTMEDTYTAGCIISKTARYDLTDSAFAAKCLYESMNKDPEFLYKTCTHLKYLVNKGFKEDIMYSLKEDTTETIPFYIDGKIIRDI